MPRVIQASLIQALFTQLLSPAALSCSAVKSDKSETVSLIKTNPIVEQLTGACSVQWVEKASIKEK